MENNSGKLIGSLLLGAAVGGALGILFAPEKGSRTRREILNKGKDLTEDLTDAMSEKLNDFLSDFKKELKNIKERANEFSFDGKSSKS